MPVTAGVGCGFAIGTKKATEVLKKKFIIQNFTHFETILLKIPEKKIKQVSKITKYIKRSTISLLIRINSKMTLVLHRFLSELARNQETKGPSLFYVKSFH